MLQNFFWQVCIILVLTTEIETSCKKLLYLFFMYPLVNIISVAMKFKFNHFTTLKCSRRIIMCIEKINSTYHPTYYHVEKVEESLGHFYLPKSGSRNARAVNELIF